MRTDESLPEGLRTLFIDTFAEAALLRHPDRDAIATNLELDLLPAPDGTGSIEGRFLFAGSGAHVPWDGTTEDAEAIVKAFAVNVAESLSLDPHEDDWRDAFEHGS